MALIPLATTDWQSPANNIGHAKLHNMYMSVSPGSPDGSTRISRPTLRTILTVGNGPIRGVWSQDGTLNGDILVVSGTTLFRVSLPSTITNLGQISGTDLVQFAGNASRVLIVANSTAYSTDGVAVTTVSMPDSLGVGSILYIDGFFILSVVDSDRFYWLAPGDVNPDPLHFATAERAPDPIVGMAAISDEIWFIGSKSVEVWQGTGDASLPFERVTGRAYNDGCSNRNTIVLSNHHNYPVAFWVTDAKSVVMAKGLIQRVSDDSVEERLKTATNLRAWSLRHNRHDFIIITSDQFTLAYDIFNQSWSTWDTYLSDIFLADIGTQIGSTPYGCSTVGNSLYILEEGHDDDGLPIVREISGKVDVTGPSTPCNSLTLKMDAGWYPEEGVEPQVEIRWSDDQGVTWGRYRSKSLGTQGQYSKEVTFRSLGSMNRPGRVIEIRYADKGRFRLDAVALNEAFQ